jgi:hypothetical protein
MYKHTIITEDLEQVNRIPARTEELNQAESFSQELHSVASPNRRKHIFFRNSETYALGHKTNLSKYKNTEIYQSEYDPSTLRAWMEMSQ